MLGLNVAGWNPTVDFPPETRVGGFDNNAAAQTTSGMLLDHYFVAAEEAIQRATAFGAKPETKTYVQKSPFYFEKRKAGDLPKIFQTDRYRWISEKGYDDLVARYYRGGPSDSSRWGTAVLRRAGVTPSVFRPRRLTA